MDAALVVGSTALGRCSDRADLDLVLLTPAAVGKAAFETRTVDGVRVEIERMDRRRALACTEGHGWVWELREAARLGCGVAVFDADGLADQLARRAASMTPSPERFEATLRRAYLVLIELSGDVGDAAWRADALRGCLDNLVLLALLQRPRRYQKAKWALADLLHAGEDALVDTVLAAYGIGSDDGAAAHDAVTGVRRLIDEVCAAAGLPSHESILAMGHAPALAEASYVSRCLDDAEDLEMSGRFVEAQYVAAFAARLAAGLVSGATGDDAASVVGAFAAAGLSERYLALFPVGDDPDDLLQATLAAADVCREAFES